MKSKNNASLSVHLPQKHIRRCAFVIVSLLLFLGIQLQFSSAVTLAHAVSLQDADPEAPPGFRLLVSEYSLNLYRKNYPNGNPDFVQVLDLSQGAALNLMHGPLSEVLPEAGQFGGDDARFQSLSLPTYWKQASVEHEKAFCVTNGSFFYMPEYPTRLPFSLKVDGEIVTEGFGGYGPQAYEGQRLMLELWDDYANIRELSGPALHLSSAPNIIAGLMEDANKNAKKTVARTFVGIQDRDQDGKAETLYLLNTSTAVQTHVAAVLREFGAEQVMMLDGGGSTQLICKGHWMIESDRLIPQAISSVAGSPPPVSSQVLDDGPWLVLQTGQNYPLRIEIENTGVLTWTKQETHLVLQKNPLSSEVRLSLKGQVPPTGTAVFTHSLAAYSHAGIYPLVLDYELLHQGKSYAGETVTQTAVVIPAELAADIPEVEAQIKEWQKEPLEVAVSLLDEWMREQDTHTNLSTQTEQVQTPEQEKDQQKKTTPTSSLSVDAQVDTQSEFHPILKDALIIPIAMLPALVMIAIVIYHIWEKRR